MIKFLQNNLIKSYGLVALLGLSTITEAQFNWSPAGPIYAAGRARNMLVDKLDPSGNTFYVGSVSSGIFKTINAGVNWAPLNDQGTIRNISFLAQSFDNTIYVGTGEGFLKPWQKYKALPGTGLYKLSGSNILPVASAAITGSIISKIACHPTNAAHIAIATEKGVMVSTNSGATFVNAVGTPTDVTGLDLKFDANGVLYCSMGFESSGLASTVWKAQGNDLTAGFANITPSSIAVPGTNYGRIELAISPLNPQVVYASCAAKYIYPASASPTLTGFFVSYDGGANWGTILVGSAQLDPLYNGGSLANGDYAHCVYVDPSNSDRVFLGGYSLYTFLRTGGSNASPIGSWTRRGTTFGWPQQYLHQNIFDVKYVGSILYVVTEAGIYRSIDGMITFQPFYQGLVTGQFNSVSIEKYPLATTSTVTGVINAHTGFIGGTAGNGAVYFRGSYPNVNPGINLPNVNQENNSLGGDVYNTEFSKILPNAAYFTLSNGPLYRNTDVRTSDPAAVDLLVNSAAQTVIGFNNSTFNTSGSPYKLWEYYGQLYNYSTNNGNNASTLTNPDNLIFYNDTSFALSAVTSLTASTNFTFTVGRPQKRAVIDRIEIRPVMVKIATTPSVITITNYSVVNSETMAIQMNTVYLNPLTGTITPTITAVEGFTNATPLTSNKVTINSTTQLDEIVVTFSAPLFTTQPISTPTVASMESYVRLKATIFYRYANNDSLFLFYDNISTLGATYSVTTPTSLRWTQPPTSTLNITSNPVQKFKLNTSARLAVAYANSGVYVSKAPLEMNTPLNLVKVSGDKAITTNSLGVALPAAPANTVNVLGKPTLLEWSKSGTELYYATDLNNLYRVSNLTDIIDSTSKSYSGKLHTGIFTYSNTPAPPTYTANAFYTPNPRSPYRTTFLGNFANKITSISLSSNDSIMALTFDDASLADTLVMVNTIHIAKCDFSNVGFVNKTTNLGNVKTYCSLIERKALPAQISPANLAQEVFVGTDQGLYYTSNILAASPTWSNVNNTQLPNVQVFDIKQQTMNSHECYNSGQIYVATNGRGVWLNKNYYKQTVIGVKEIVASAHANNLSIFPNPTNGLVNISFRGYDNEDITINVMDINGRLVKSERLGKLTNGDVKHSFETTDLASGVYIVNVSSDSGIRRVSKLIVTK